MFYEGVRSANEVKTVGSTSADRDADNVAVTGETSRGVSVQMGPLDPIVMGDKHLLRKRITQLLKNSPNGLYKAESLIIGIVRFKIDTYRGC